MLGISFERLDVFCDFSPLADLRGAWLSAEFIEEHLASARPLDTEVAVLDDALGVMKKVPAAASGRWYECLSYNKLHEKVAVQIW